MGGRHFHFQPVYRENPGFTLLKSLVISQNTAGIPHIENKSGLLIDENCEAVEEFCVWYAYRFTLPTAPLPSINSRSDQTCKGVVCISQPATGSACAKEGAAVGTLTSLINLLLLQTCSYTCLQPSCFLCGCAKPQILQRQSVETMLFIIYHELMNMVPLTSLLQNFEMDPVRNDDTIYF